jgi:hypothetical protein
MTLVTVRFTLSKNPFAHAAGMTTKVGAMTATIAMTETTAMAGGIDTAETTAVAMAVMTGTAAMTAMTTAPIGANVKSAKTGKSDCCAAAAPETATVTECPGGDACLA